MEASMVLKAIVVAAVVLGAGSANAQNVSVSCVGVCSPAWDTDYDLRIDAGPRDSLMGFTIKSRSLADGRTRPGDACIGRFSPTVPHGRWPNHTGGANFPCRFSLDRNVRTVTWRSPACSDHLRSNQIKFNLKGEWRGASRWSNAFLDFRRAPSCASPTSDSYMTLDGLRVSPGRVQFRFFSAGNCIQLSNTTINGVRYTVHYSKWQRRSSSTGPWEDVAGTRRSDGLCSYTPTSPGEYRLVGEMSIDGVRGMYASENTITV